MTESLTELERRVLVESLKGPEPWKSALRKQVSGLRVVRRDDTVVGGYTHFELPEAYERANVNSRTESYPPVVDVSHPNLPEGGAFVVWVRDGAISTLEYYVNGNYPWPTQAHVEDFEFPEVS